jgi:hypothetical protein
MEQMMEVILAKMHSFQEKIRDQSRRLDAKVEVNHEEVADLKTHLDRLASHIDVNQENTDSWLEEIRDE